MAQQLRFILDGADRGQPLNPDDFGFTINEDSDLNFRVVSFNNDLTFGGETYDYLFTELVDNGGCQLVQVAVQYKCGSAWKPLVNGWLIISECVFDLDKCQVKTRLYDESFSTKINNNKAIPFSSASLKTKNLTTITRPTVWNIQMFNPATGNWDPTELIGCIAVYDAFAHIIKCMSDGMVDFDSNLFRFTVPADGENTDVIMMTNGRAIFSRNQSETIYSFEQLYVALNKKLRLGMAFERQANGRPLLRIEEAEYFFNLTPSANLYDQPSIDLSFDTSQLFATIGFGNDPFLEQNECDGGNTPCSFTQTPFRGFKSESFGMLGECNTSAQLSLETSQVIFDTNVIEDIYRFDSQSYMDNPVIIDCTMYVESSVGTILAKKGDPYGVGGAVYNTQFRNENVASNWIGGYPNSIYQYIQGFNPVQTVAIGYANWVVNPAFDIIFPDYTSYLQFSGQFIEFNNETDPYNNFDGTTYTVPYAGIYSFGAQVVLGTLGLPDSRAGFASIKHYDANDNLIQTINGTIDTALNINALIVSVSADMVCNKGDLIRVDVSCAFTSPGPTVSQPILTDTTIVGENFATSFSMQGQPFQPSELEPVDPNSVRRLIYKFERPLTMEEVVSILNNTSSPIKFGKWNDPLRVIPGYIKTVNVQSVIKQNANFELKSNQILR